MIYPPGDLGWLEVVKSFQHTAYRLEQQPIYLDDVRAGLLDDWLAGATEPPGPNDWSRLIEAKTAAGAEVVRVRVIEDPPTPYQQWIKWYSAKNTAAGEQHHYIDRGSAVKGGVNPHWDFWLLDGETLVVFDFEDQEQTVSVTKQSWHLAHALTAWGKAMSIVEAVTV